MYSVDCLSVIYMYMEFVLYEAYKLTCPMHSIKLTSQAVSPYSDLWASLGYRNWSWSTMSCAKHEPMFSVAKSEAEGWGFWHYWSPRAMFSHGIGNHELILLLHANWLMFSFVVHTNINSWKKSWNWQFVAHIMVDREIIPLFSLLNDLLLSFELHRKWTGVNH